MSIDMSAQAVTLRLKRVSQLRRLCLALSKAKLVEPEKAFAPKPLSTEASDRRESITKAGMNTDERG